MPTLRGIGWDHERCMGPLRAAARVWRERAGVDVEWGVRSLASFNDQPVEELALEADLLVVDHPFSGTAAATGCLVPFDRLLPEETLEALAADAIGPSHASYLYAGCQWALALDAACQVAVARDDLLPALGARAPATWDEVTALAVRAPSRVALPLYPTDAVCSLLTIAANAGRPAAAGETLFSSREAGEEAVGRLGELARLVHQDSFELNPPALLDRMRETDDLAYAPLTFGYTNYARPGAPGRRLRFLDVPSSGLGPVGSLLGGAGLAVSAASASQDRRRRSPPGSAAPTSSGSSSSLPEASPEAAASGSIRHSTRRREASSAARSRRSRPPTCARATRGGRASRKRRASCSPRRCEQAGRLPRPSTRSSGCSRRTGPESA